MPPTPLFSLKMTDVARLTPVWAPQCGLRACSRPVAANPQLSRVSASLALPPPGAPAVSTPPGHDPRPHGALGPVTEGPDVRDLHDGLCSKKQTMSFQGFSCSRGWSKHSVPEGCVTPAWLLLAGRGKCLQP